MEGVKSFKIADDIDQKYYLTFNKALKLLIVGEREKSLLTFEAIINDEKSPIDLKIRFASEFSSLIFEEIKIFSSSS